MSGTCTQGPWGSRPAGCLQAEATLLCPHAASKGFSHPAGLSTVKVFRRLSCRGSGHAGVPLAPTPALAAPLWGPGPRVVTSGSGWPCLLAAPPSVITSEHPSSASPSISPHQRPWHDLDLPHLCIHPAQAYSGLSQAPWCPPSCCESGHGLGAGRGLTASGRGGL